METEYKTASRKTQTTMGWYRINDDLRMIGMRECWRSVKKQGKAEGSCWTLMVFKLLRREERLLISTLVYTYTNGLSFLKIKNVNTRGLYRQQRNSIRCMSLQWYLPIVWVGWPVVWGTCDILWFDFRWEIILYCVCKNVSSRQRHVGILYANKSPDDNIVVFARIIILYSYHLIYYFYKELKKRKNYLYFYLDVFSIDDEVYIVVSL